MKAVSTSLRPSLLDLSRVWHAVSIAGIVSILVVGVFGTMWWSQQAGHAAERAAIDRLDAVGRAFLAANAGEPPSTVAIAGLVASDPGLKSAIVVPAREADGVVSPGWARVSIELPQNGGFLVLEGRVTSRSTGWSASLPVFGVMLAGVGLTAWSGWWFATRTASLRRVASGLASIERGETNPELLRVAERFGPVAIAWNSLVVAGCDDADHMQTDSIDRRKESVPHASISTSTLDAIPMGVIGLDRAGRTVFCNGAAAAMLGADRSSMLTQRFDELPILSELADSIALVADGDRPRHQCELSDQGTDASGTLRVCIRGMRRTDGASVMVLIEDITQQRLADEARDAFVMQATHELRTPLTNIKLAAEDAIETLGDDPETAALSLNIVNKEATRLERVVSDMLSVSEMEAASMSLDMDDVSPSALLDALESDYQSQALEKGVEFTVNRPPKLQLVYGDREKIGVLLHNLVGNAIKYTPQGGSVTVSAMQTDSSWEVEVRDTGVGIAADEHAKVFEKFYRTGAAHDSEIVGSGLGLALAAEIAKLHGGDISLKSEVGEGSVFTVRFPIAGTIAVLRSAA